MFEFFKKNQDQKPNPKPKYATNEEDMLARYKQELEELENSSYLKTMYHVVKDIDTGETLRLEEVPIKKTFEFLFDGNKRKMDTRSFLALDTIHIVTNCEKGYTRKSFYSLGSFDGKYAAYYDPVLHILYDNNTEQYYFEMTEYMSESDRNRPYSYEYKSKAYDDVVSLQKEVIRLNDIIRIEREIERLEKIVAKQQLEAKAWSSVKTLR